MMRYREADGQEQNGQRRLDELDWHTAAMVTGLDWREEDVWHFYNQRCAQENYIKEMKSGFGMDRIPTASGFDGEGWIAISGDPGGMPGFFPISPVIGNDARADQKALILLQLMDVVPGLKYPAALQDGMNQIVIPHRRPELIAGQAAFRTTLVHI